MFPVSFVVVVIVILRYKRQTPHDVVLCPASVTPRWRLEPVDGVDGVLGHVRLGQAQSLPDVQQPGPGRWRPILQRAGRAVVTLSGHLCR